MTEHKHKTAIIAFANGMELEYKNSYGVWWEYMPSDFPEFMNIRIKPEDSMTDVHKAKLNLIAELKETINHLERNL